MTTRTEIINILTKKTLGLTFVLSAAAFAYAQVKVNVTGNIVDKQNNPVPYASVTFSSKTNKIFSDAVLADEKGNYTLQLVPGNYDVTVEAIGFRKITSTKMIAGGSVGSISIEAENPGTITPTKNIEGVTITAAAPKPYRVELDKKTYDPSTDLISKGGSLQDVLANVPSVSVDTDGTVSMRGSSNVRFLINGKPSALLGIDDGANALQSIPADQIEKIEVISNPSSKFEASGTAGILNIILKKNKRVGFNGSVTGSLGYLPTTGLNTNLSWRRNNLTWFLNGGGGYRESKGENNSDTWYNFPNADVPKESHQESTSENNGKNYNATTGFVYDFSDRTSVNASGTIRGFNSESNGNTFREELFLSRNEFSERLDDGNGRNLALQGDFGLDHKFDDKGQNIALSLSLQRNKSNSNSVAREYISGVRDFVYEDENALVNDLTFKDLLAQNSLNRSIVGKADYELPIGEKSELEAGYRLDINRNNYENDVNRQDQDNMTLTQLPLFTNTTDYKETFNAAYAQFKSKIGNFGYQLGLRNEYSVINIDYANLQGDKILKDKKYNNIFPSIYLSYDLGKDNQLLLNFSKRIDRPRSFFMVPYARYSNPRSVFEGNIDLDPSYVDSYEVGYSIQKRKLTINPTLYYRHSTDDTKMLSYRKDERENVVYTKPINLGTEDRYGLDFNFSYDPVSWLKLMGGLDLYGYKSEGTAQYDALDRDGNTVVRTRDFAGDGFSTRARLNTTFRIDKTFSVQLQGQYRGGEKTATTEQKPMYGMNLGASKTIWNGNGTFTFNIQDVFNTRNRTVKTFNEDLTSENYMKWMPRQFALSFTYRFKQGEKVEVPRRKKDINSNAGGDDDMPPM